MRIQTTASKPVSRNGRASRQHRGASRMRSAVRFRSAVVCALIAGGIYAARKPESLLGRARAQAHVSLPRLPVESVLRDAESAEKAGRPVEAAHLYELVCTQHASEPVAEAAYLK